ncbi:hypothetical protein F4827_002902 [Paraburkholderia bannensis]|uniref:Sulfotransferase family protein n=1 Tax=Paraburkholderia bannensis TaxID=765414 RepID=A0A7W9WT01_9BURK|nr:MULTISPECIES: hypothetical protein [Paraburkholderia]MBB6103049.1 hypothetical protein [Paraburkholderia bannensis]
MIPGNAVVENKTIVVLGFARGGTSLISGMLREFGVFMGDNAHALKHEIDLFHENDSSQAIIHRVEDLDKQYKMWGWKSPRAVFFVDKLACYLSNPHFIIALRNPIAVCQSVGRHNKLPMAVTMRDIAPVFSAIAEFTSRCPYPLAFFNFDEVNESPRQLVEDLREFLGISDPDGKLAAKATAFFHAEGGYHAVSADVDRAEELRLNLEVDNRIDSIGIIESLVPPRVNQMREMTRLLEEDSSKADAIVKHLGNKLDKLRATQAEVESSIDGKEVDGDAEEMSPVLDSANIYENNIEEKLAYVDKNWFRAEETLSMYAEANAELHRATLRRHSLQRQIGKLESLISEATTVKGTTSE